MSSSLHTSRWQVGLGPKDKLFAGVEVAGVGVAMRARLKLSAGLSLEAQLQLCTSCRGVAATENWHEVGGRANASLEIQKKPVSTTKNRSKCLDGQEMISKHMAATHFHHNHRGR